MTCPETAQWNDRTVECEREAGHAGVHWDNDAGVIWP